MKKKRKKRHYFWYKASTKKALQLQLEQRSYKINPSVEHQCYVYYLDQFFSNILYNKINNAFVQCPYLYFNKQTKKLGGSLRKVQLRLKENNTTSLETNHISIFIYIYIYIYIDVYI